jgi:hypothetical protein
MGILHIGKFLDEKDFEGLRTRVSRLRNEPALLSWLLSDEPEGHGVTIEDLRKEYRIIKSIDPNHPVFVNTTAPDRCTLYAGCADVIGTNPYPIGNPWGERARIQASATCQIPRTGRMQLSPRRRPTDRVCG